MRRTYLKPAAIPALLLFTALLFSGCSNNHANHAGMNNGQPIPKKPSKINWLSFDEGKKRAQEEDKLMVVDFWVSQGCHRCEMMAWKVWSDQKVIDLMEGEFIPVRVDIEAAMSPGARALGEKYDYNFECLLVVCSPSGEAVQDETTGRMCFSELITADWFISYLKQAAGMDDDFFSDME